MDVDIEFDDDDFEIVMPKRPSPPRGPVPKVIHTEASGKSKSNSKSSTNSLATVAPMAPPQEEMSLMQRMAMRMNGLDINAAENAVPSEVSSAMSAMDTASSFKSAKKKPVGRRNASKNKMEDSEDEYSDVSMESATVPAKKATSKAGAASKKGATKTQQEPAAEAKPRAPRRAVVQKKVYVESDVSDMSEEDDVSSVDLSDLEESDYCPSD